MAKKVVINGSNLLSNLSDDWGGLNNSGSAQTVYGTTVPAGAEWGVNRGEIERFIKAQFGTKVGATRWVLGDTDAGEDSTFYYLDGFAKEADIATYDSDPTTYAALRLFHKRLPISTVSSDSYICQLSSDVSTTPNYAKQNGSDFDIHLRYQSIYVIAATSQSQNYSAYGTITIERSLNGGSSWTQVDKISGISSADPTATTYPVTVQLGKYLVNDRTNRFRLRASFQYSDEGTTQTRYSAYVTYSIQTVNLSVNMDTNWALPITANASTSQIALAFNLFGAIQKTLHICLDGDEEHALVNWTGSYDATYNGISTGNITLTDSTRAYFTHGLHEVRTWLTCSDGNGGTLSSDVMIYHLMIYNASTAGADLTKPYLMIEELASDVPNFVQSKICAYAVYNAGSSTPITLALVIGASAGSIITVPQEEYYRLETTAVQGTKYELDATLEIESDSAHPDAYLHVTRTKDGNTTDFLYESTGVAYQVVSVDNTAGYAPTAGSTFYLNPKLRNNSEANPARILNARAQNAEIESVWTNFKFGTQDGWTNDEEGNKVLRIPAGSLLNIKMNPFAQFLTTPASSLTMDFDICIRNVTNEDDPIIRLCEQIGQNFIGLRMAAMTGYIATASHTSIATSDFRWQEDVRTHIAINICNAIAPNSARDGLTSDGTTPTGTLPLVRVLINGGIEREYVFDNTAANEFCTAALSNGGIFIGQEGADIDIYGIRMWASQQLSAQQEHQNYVSTLPSAEAKIREKTQNDIMEGGKISYDKVRAVGKNVLIWHGQEVWHGASSTQRGYWEFYMYDTNGQMIPELSGTICRETASLPCKGQGTTAKTYYYWNLQTKYSDVEATITIPLTQLHSSITQGAITTDGDDRFIALKGGNLGKNFPLPTESTKNYPFVEVEGVNCVVVPDGWIDGNGMYRGVGHHVALGLPLAQKDVLKINYASGMQSHIVGVNKLYNRLHTAFVGENALQSAVDGAVVAKELEPFMFFTQASENADIVYRGVGTWGAGKMDKPTWGYVKSEYPNFTMIEGADNNKELTDMRVPFDDTVHGSDTYPKVYYIPEEEAFYYRTESGLQNSQKSIDFDGGKTVNITQTDSTHIFTGEYPDPTIVNYIRNTWNFLFLHNPRIKPFITSGGTVGSFADFTSSASASDFGNKYWCSDYKLYRYDFADRAWVNAGLWNGTSYDEVNLRDSSAESGTIAYYTYTRWNALSTNEKADYEGAVNNAFIAGIVAHCKANIGTYFMIDSLKFHYVFQNHFIAGTDNCSKNTYYVLVPITENNTTVWKFQMHQDDVDTVLATDNSGLQTKPYYIDRMHPFADDDTQEADCLYEGRNNVLFNLCEEMWEGTLELADAMRSVFTLMAGMASSIEGTPESSALTGCWGTLNKYIFDIQRYFPAMAYNEAARIRYEFPKLMNYVSDQRQVDPITQSMGRQLEAELQWMKRRLVYMASYAAFGEFTPGSTASTGLTDLAQSFAMVMAALPNSTTQTSVFKYKLVPHQYLYPTAALAQSSVNPHIRVAPNAANMPNGYYELIITPTGRSDDGVTVYGINYYRSIGNIGDNCFDSTTALTLNGKRLTSFVAEPTTYYSTTIGGGSITAAAWQALSDTEKANYRPAFRCAGLQVGTATRLSSLNMNGCSVMGGSSINLSGLVRAASIDLRGTDITTVVVPQTPVLHTLRLPSRIATLSLTAQAALATLTFEGYGSLTQITITGSPLLGTVMRGIVLGMRDAGTNVTLINLAHLAWTSQPVEADVIRWLISVGDTGTCLLTGMIGVVNGTTGILYYDDVATLITRYGDIRDTDNELYINFSGTPIAASSMSLDGKKYINTDSTSAGYDLDENHNFNGLSLLVANGNDVAVATKEDGSKTPDVTYELTDDVSGTYAEFPDPYSPVLHLIQTGAAVRGITLNVKVTLTNTSGETRVTTKIIGLWNRIPEVGDYAWTDGQFDNQNDASKKLAGMVIRKEEVTDGSGNITSYKLTILSAADTTFNTSLVVSGYESTWGLYPSASQGFSDAKTDGAYDDAVMEAVRQATGRSDVFDTPLPNQDGGSYIRKNAAAVSAAGNGIAMQDETNVANNGYAVYSQVWMNNFNTESENATLLAYADTVLQAAYTAMGITQQDYESIRASGGCTSAGIPKTTTGLYQIAEMIVQKAQDSGATNVYRYRELLFLAMRRCNVWCPADMSGSGIEEEDLHESYGRGKWMLPSSGLMARIFNFMANSRAAYNTSSAPAQQYAEQSEGGQAPDVSLEAQKPLFANAIARGRSIPISYSSYHWCVTEGNRNFARLVNFSDGYASSYGKYNGFVIRGVAAFNFVP